METLTIGVVYHDEYIGSEFENRRILIRNVRGVGWGFPDFIIKPNQSIAKSFCRRLSPETEGRCRIRKRKYNFTIEYEGQLVRVYTFDFEGNIGSISDKRGGGYTRVVTDVMPYQFTTLAKMILNHLPQPEIKKSQLWQVPEL